MIRDVKWEKNLVAVAIFALAITFYMPTSEAQEKVGPSSTALDA